MNRKIAILRGINVGGKRKILMADLKALCENLNWGNVTTYIQSGNVVFNSDKTNTKLENELEKAIAESFGFQVPVIVRTAQELQSAIDQNPFINEDITQLHLTFLKENPSEDVLQKILAYNYQPDRYKIEGKAVFIYCSGKYHKSKLSNNFFEKKLNTGATTRNWKTVLKLSELINN